MRSIAGTFILWASLSTANAQESFYIYERTAMAGNYAAQRNAAFCLRTAKCDGVILPRIIDACAWRMVILASGHPAVNPSDFENYQDDCIATLSTEERMTALYRADQWFKRIYKQDFPPDSLPP